MGFLSWLTNLGMGGLDPIPPLVTDEAKAYFLETDASAQAVIEVDEANAYLEEIDEANV